jgi:alkylated DNA repair protein (DNA oxidative demethylase)
MLSGIRYLPGYFDADRQKALLEELRSVVAAAPFYRPKMPRSGRPFSVEMTNAGPLGWFSDRTGYRYITHHPISGNPWPDMPPMASALWQDLADYPVAAQCCLLNFYREEGARMGLHQDRDEDVFDAAVISVSLGNTAVFRIGGTTRRGPTSSLKLYSGDVVMLTGAARLAFHGIDRVLGGSSRLLREGGRLNLTLRRVTRP